MAKNTKTASGAVSPPSEETDVDQAGQGGGAGADKAGSTGPNADIETNFIEPAIRVAAPAGPRRRAGISFGPVARDVALHELGDTHEEQQAALRKLLDDPALSVSPVIEG